MIDPLTKYREALAAFATPGGRWANKGALTYWGKAAGLSADDLIADARAHGVNDRDAEIRNGWNDARPKFVNGKPTADYTPRARVQAQPRRKVVWRANAPTAGEGTGTAAEWQETFAKPGEHPFYVREKIGDLDAAQGGCADWVRELSPCLDWLGEPPTVQTALYMRALFAPSEMVHVLDISDPPNGKPGANIRAAADWVRMIEDGGTLPGDGLLPNPLTGKLGTTTAGKPSYIANSTIADFPFMVIEFDDMPLPLQFAFWRGFALTSRLAPMLVAVTRSGGKSLHGVLHVGCKTADQWDAVRGRLAGLLCSDPEKHTVTDKGGNPKDVYPFRCDPQSMRVRQATRLAGARRLDAKHRGAVQELVYLNPRARAGTMWRDAVPMPPPPIDPDGKPPCGEGYGMGMCGVCDALGRCPFAVPDAVRGTTMKGGAAC